MQARTRIKDDDPEIDDGFPSHIRVLLGANERGVCPRAHHNKKGFIYG